MKITKLTLFAFIIVFALAVGLNWSLSKDPHTRYTKKSFGYFDLPLNKNTAHMSFEIEVPKFSWYRYNYFIGPLDYEGIPKIANAQNGQIANLKIQILDNTRKVIHENSIIFSLLNGRIVDDKLQAKSMNPSINTKLPKFSGNNLQVVLTFTAIQQDIFTEHAYLRFYSEQTRRCIFIECLLD